MIGHRSARLTMVVGAAALLTVACSSSSSDSSSSASSAPVDSASAASSGAASASTEGSPAAAGPLSIAGVYENTQDAFWGTFLCGAQQKAADLGLNFTPFTNATADNTKMATMLDSALLTDPDAVIFNPIDTTPWETKIKSVMDDGVPVVTAQPAPDSQLGYVTSSGDGSPFIQQFLDVLKDEKGKAVILNGMADAQWQHDRLDKIVDGIKQGAPGLEFLPTQVDGFDVNKGTQIISGLITANPDLKLILAVAGPEGQAVAAAVKQNEMEDQIHVIAFDAVPAEVDGLRDGSVDFLVAQPAFTMGEEQMQALVDYLSAHPGTSGPVPAGGLEPKVMDMGLLTPENVDSPESKAFIYSSTCS